MTPVGGRRTDIDSSELLDSDHCQRRDERLHTFSLTFTESNRREEITKAMEKKILG